ncbi:DUF2949 domain-containing protein [Trichothermofontia sichuanensis B231]|uniref:DUF2949 domain-containing protein n=1 Tax=Trichothermofontia sichuanensis TaxID=3045816 RepID=UPI0022474386|nr:DUF2949 domain-containing protein [Trichothermofontia sichuanensis]UZQ54062.1 DUF2949 domain-containing protein [Trichothermofontia sichuanensis B231]
MPALPKALLRFLEEDLRLSAAAIALAVRYTERSEGNLPIVLWQYGLISLTQLDQLLTWLAGPGSEDNIGAIDSLVGC